MASSALGGQTALCTLPPAPYANKASWSKGESIDTFSPPVQLQIGENVTGKRGTSAGVLGNGLDVYKVAKTGKRQQRRIGISKDNSCILISTDRGGRFLKKSSKASLDTQARRIEICSIDRLVKGQVTKKFLNKTNKNDNQNLMKKVPFSEENISLSIVFRVSTASTHSIVEEEDLQISTDSTNAFGSLDLVIPSHNDYEVLYRTLQALMGLYKKYRNSVQTNIVLLQHHWMEIGKSLRDPIHQGEWTSMLIDRISVPLSKATITSLFRKYCQHYNIKPEMGLSLPKAVGLLDRTRDKSVKASEHKVDPCEDVWNQVLNYNIEYQPMDMKGTTLADIPQNSEVNLFAHLSEERYNGYSSSDDDGDSDRPAQESAASPKQSLKSGKSGKSGRTSSTTKTTGSKSTKADVGGEEVFVSAAAFLRFLHIEQGDTKTTLMQVKDLFQRLNGLTVASQIGENGTSRKIVSCVEESYSREYITKGVFCNYLRSDMNDTFDPYRGQWEQDDLTQPLSSYWINSSHDTFLRDTPPKIIGDTHRKIEAIDADCPLENDVQMFTTALHRGCRCLELDVWDGAGKQTGEPVVCFDVSTHKKSAHYRTLNMEGLYFSEILRAVRSFLMSNPSSLPIILFIENHCSLSNQTKMANEIQAVLQDTLYVPSMRKPGVKVDSLPSPDELRGMVVIKSKIPSKFGEGTTAVFDDYDDENDINPFDLEVDIESDYIEDFADATIKSAESIVSDSPHMDEDVTPGELLERAQKEAAQAMKESTAAEEQSFKAHVKANRAEDFVSQLLKKIGMSLEEAEEHYKDVLPARFKSRSKSSKTRMDERAAYSAYATARENEEKAQHTYLFADSAGLSTNDDDDVTASTGLNSIHGNDRAAHFDEVVDRIYDETIQKIAALGKNFNCGDFDLKCGDDHHDDDTFDNDSECRQTVGSFSTRGTNPGDERDVLSINTDLDNDPRETQIMIQHNSSDKEDEDEGVEVQDIYTSTVETAIAGFSEADQKAKAAKDTVLVAETVLRRAEQDLKQAEDDYAQAEIRKRNAEGSILKSEMKAKDAKDRAGATKRHVDEMQELVDKYTEKANTAHTVASTAKTESKISKQRAEEAEQRAKRSIQTAKADHAAADVETEKELEQEGVVAGIQKQYKIRNFEAKTARQKVQVIRDALIKAENQIKSYESNQQYRDEQQAIQSGETSEQDAKIVKKCEAKKKERQSLLERLATANKEKDGKEDILLKKRREFEDATGRMKEQGKVATKARNQADQSTSVSEQLMEYADEEKEAAEMRHAASEKAEANVQKVEAQRAAASTKLANAQHSVIDAEDEIMRTTMFAERTAGQAMKDTNVKKYQVRLESRQNKLQQAQEAHDKAVKDHKASEDAAHQVSHSLNQNVDLYYKAKVVAQKSKHRANEQRQMENNALTALKRYRELVQEAEVAKKHATKAKTNAAEKASEVRYAKDYKLKKSKIRDVSVDLAKITTFHSDKFRFWEKSLALPFDVIHNISEGKMLKLLAGGGANDNEKENWKEYNKSHLTRVYPSRLKQLRESSSNFNPVLAWSQGCQFASMNQQVCDAFVLVNDGRFRVNGSCGYVLKPEFMIQRKGGDLSRMNKDPDNMPYTWKIKILSGYNLTKPRQKATVGPINPRVRVTLYDGGLSAPYVHLTKTVKKDGFNPIWNEKDGATFEVMEPSSAILLFSLWDYNEALENEDFIAAAAMPISCMRLGYRSVPLFDSNLMRCGSHGFSCLFVQVSEQKN